MTTGARKLIRPFLAAANRAASLLTHRSGQYRILLFHHVPEEHYDAFEDVVRSLHRTDRLLSPIEAKSLTLAGGPARHPRDPVLLSFDDGFHSNLIVAERILSRYQAQALFFVCPGLMDQPTSAQRGLIASQIFEDKIQANDIGDRRLLTWGEAARLLELGHVIGSHSLSHRRLSRLAPDEIETEVGEAAAMLRRRGFSAEWFAFPFGDVASISPVALATIAKHHLLCRSGVRGINSPRGNPLTLCADHVDLDADPPWRNLAAEGALGLVYGSARRSLAKYARLASEHAHDVLTKTARAE